MFSWTQQSKVKLQPTIHGLPSLLMTWWLWWLGFQWRTPLLQFCSTYFTLFSTVSFFACLRVLDFHPLPFLAVFLSACSWINHLKNVYLKDPFGYHGNVKKTNVKTPDFLKSKGIDFTFLGWKGIHFSHIFKSKNSTKSPKQETQTRLCNFLLDT